MRCEERIGRRLDVRELEERLLSGEFQMLAAYGGREEYAVPVGKRTYVVVYDRPSGRFVTTPYGAERTSVAAVSFAEVDEGWPLERLALELEVATSAL